jgi:putative flippase GtrA
MDDRIRFTCTACGKHLKAKPQFAGHRVRCSCGGTPTVPVPQRPIAAKGPPQRLADRADGFLAIDCPACGKAFPVTESAFGKQVFCSACGSPVTASWENAHRAAGPREPAGELPSRPIRKVRPVSKAFYVTAVAGGIGIGMILVALPVLAGHSDEAVGSGLIAIGGLAMLLGAIVNMVLWYKMWAAIQDGSARTTPGAAIGLLFIPFFNFYWVFQAIGGFPKDYNQFIRRHGINARELPGGLFIAYCILCLTGGIPVLGVLLVLVNYVVGIVMTCKICNAINVLASPQGQLRSPDSAIRLASGGHAPALPRPKRKEAISYGAAGLILVCFRLLNLPPFLPEPIQLLGGVTALVGLGICIAGIVKGSGRPQGILGVCLFLALWGLHVVIELAAAR